MPTTCSLFARFTMSAAILLIPFGATATGKLVFVPTSLNFGFNALGETKTKIATLKNGTATAIPLNPATLAGNPGGYTITSTTCGATLAAGQTCKYTLRYTAKTLKLAAARLELTTLDPAYPLLKLPLQANLYLALNDTGITRCADIDENGLTCPTHIPEQDAEYGRDKTRNISTNGKAGFNYAKIDSRGRTLPAKATAWDCVKDNVTGLVWERKPIGDSVPGNQGLHDPDDKYTWYSTDFDNNGGTPGYEILGNYCFGYVSGQPMTYCNTEAFVNRVNKARWCGFTDWRLPDRFELLSLMDLSTYRGLDRDYFPDMRTWLNFWTSSTLRSGLDIYGEDRSEYVDFGYGDSVSGYRYYKLSVRLVRGDH